MNKIPPFLYHGTRAERLDDILDLGLRPRNETGISHWKHTSESRPDAVYLTTAYPLHFAANAQMEGDLIVVEVDTSKLDHSQLIADEDALAQCLKDPAVAHLTLVEKAAYYREISHEFSAADSLARLGNCAHLGTVPRRALTRVVRVTIEHGARLIAWGFDPVICPPNFRFFGEQYADSVQWLFGDREVCAINPEMPKVPIEVTVLTA